MLLHSVTPAMPAACSGLARLESVVHFWVHEVAMDPNAAGALLVAQPQLIMLAPAAQPAKLQQLRVLLQGSPWSAEEIVAGPLRRWWLGR